MSCEDLPYDGRRVDRMRGGEGIESERTDDCARLGWFNFAKLQNRAALDLGDTKQASWSRVGGIVWELRQEL